MSPGQRKAALLDDLRKRTACKAKDGEEDKHGRYSEHPARHSQGDPPGLSGKRPEREGREENRLPREVGAGSAGGRGVHGPRDASQTEQEKRTQKPTSHRHLGEGARPSKQDRDSEHHKQGRTDDRLG